MVLRVSLAAFGLRVAAADYAQAAVIALVTELADGGLQVNTPDAGLALPEDGSWAQVSNVFWADAGASVGVRVLAHSNGMGSAFFVDDAAVWFSPDGGCTDGP